MKKGYEGFANTQYIGEHILEFIASTFEPEDVFSKDALKNWAQNYSPEEIFSEEELTDWAYENGFHLSPEAM